MSIIRNRPLLYKLYDDSDDEDRDDFIVKEVRCCNCFFDMIIKVIEGKKELTFNFLNEKVFTPRKLRFRKRGDIFFYFRKFVFLLAKNIRIYLKIFLKLIKMKWIKIVLQNMLILTVFIFYREKHYFSPFVMVVVEH